MLPSKKKIDLKHFVLRGQILQGRWLMCLPCCLTVWTITVCATVNWHNCQLFLSKEFLLLFQRKPQQPEKCVLSINHKALTHCSSVSWVRQVHFSEKDNGYPLRPPLHTQTHCHRCKAPPQNPTSFCALL